MRSVSGTSNVGGVRVTTPALAAVLALGCAALAGCEHHEEHAHDEHHKIVTTSPQKKDVTVTQQYVALIHARKHINIRAMQTGYLEAVSLREGQAVKEGEVMFRVVPRLFKARLAAEMAKARLAQVKFDAAQRLLDKNVVAPTEIAIQQAELDEAKAKADVATAELDFTAVKAPFNGIVDRLREQQGSLVKENDVLTTLSDNSLMWVYFNVPETRFLGYRAGQGKNHTDERLKLPDSRIELVLADGRKFDQSAGDTLTIEGKFNNETGNIPFRADFPNPDGLLRHGQTGSVLVHRTLRDAIVIPQRATFEILDKQFVYVVGPDGTVRQREIVVQNELEDVFVLKSGVDAGERIVLEGVQQVHDGEKVEAEFRKPDEVMAHQKVHAE